MASLTVGKYCGVASKANIVMVKNSYHLNYGTTDGPALDDIRLRTTQNVLEWIWQDIEANNIQGKAVILHAKGKQNSSRRTNEGPRSFLDMLECIQKQTTKLRIIVLTLRNRILESIEGS